MSRRGSLSRNRLIIGNLNACEGRALREPSGAGDTGILEVPVEG